LITAYETVSSFSNTGGGWLVFGIRDYDGHYEVAGVLEVDKVQNDFLSALRAGNKVNHDIKVETELIVVGHKTVLAFRIPETSRQDKPIYLNGDIRRSFIRRGWTGFQLFTGGSLSSRVNQMVPGIVQRKKSRS
jgi:ATP-dependent DNA helicase RecG